MKQQQQTSITSLPASPADERKSRMIKYTIATGIRMVCIVLAIVVHGWISIPFIVGAIVLPYFAVIGANVSTRAGVDVLSPDDRALQRYVPAQPSADTSDAQWREAEWTAAGWTEAGWTAPAWTAPEERDADTTWRAEQAASGASGTAPADGPDRP